MKQFHGRSEVLVKIMMSLNAQIVANNKSHKVV
jgi:hypothetical protein